MPKRKRNTNDIDYASSPCRVCFEWVRMRHYVHCWQCFDTFHLVCYRKHLASECYNCLDHQTKEPPDFDDDSLTRPASIFANAAGRALHIQVRGHTSGQIH